MSLLRNLYRMYRRFMATPEITLPVRISWHGKSVVAQTLLDTGWSGSTLGPDLALELGITLPPPGEEDRLKFDRIELLPPSGRGKPVCSIGPLWIYVSSHPGMKRVFVMGSELLSLFRFVFSYEKGKKSYEFQCPPIEEIPRKFMRMRMTPLEVPSLGVPVRLSSGTHSVIKWAELDTGAATSVVGWNIPKLLGFPNPAQLARSLTRYAGYGERASAFRVPLRNIEILDKNGEVVCRTGPSQVTVTPHFEPGSVRIGRDIMKKLQMTFGYPPGEIFFRCKGLSMKGAPRRISHRWRPV